MSGKPALKRAAPPFRIVLDGLPYNDTYRDFFTHSADAILLADPVTGILLDLNPAAEALLKKPAAFLLGRSQRILHPDADLRVDKLRFARHAAMCRLGRVVRSESTIRAGRRVVPVEIVTQRIVLHGRACVQGIFRDISRTRRIQQSLTDSIKRYHSLFSRMTEAFALHELVTDSKGRPKDYRFLEVNPSFEQHTGLLRKKLIGRTFRQVLKGEDPLWLRIYGEVVKSGKPVSFEHYSMTLKRYFQVLAYCPAPGQFATLFSDITERRRAENELRFSEERLLALVRASSHIMWTSDSNGKLNYIHSPRPFTGYPLKELLATGWLKVVHAQDRPAVNRTWRRCVRERSVYISEYRMRRADGQYRHMLSRGVPIFNPDGSVREWIGICTDITESKRNDLERRRFSELMMRAREDERGQLSALLHDEMGSWTVSLSSALVLAEGDLRSGQSRAALLKLKRARRLIKVMAARARGFCLELRPPAMDISGLSGAVSDLVARLRAVIRPKITLKLSLPDESKINEWVKIVAYRIVQEALTNILKYADARAIAVSVQVTGETGSVLRLRITDDGRGFDLEKLRPRRDSLGLRIMQNEAESAGGVWAVESVPGKGTVIWAQFPLTGPDGGKYAD